MRRACLVLGGGGFLGSHIVAALLSRGDQVKVLDRFCGGVLNLGQVIGQAEVIDGDFRDIELLKSTLKDVDFVFHYASVTLPTASNQNPMDDIESNLIGTVHLLEEAARSGVRKIIFPSSGGTVYGIPREIPIPEFHPTEPLCSYGIVKLAIEKYLYLFHHLYGLEYTILRYSNPYGERQNPFGQQGVVTVCLGHLTRGEPMEIWGDGSVVRDLIYVGDLVEATLAAADYTGNLRVFNIGSGVGISMNELVSTINEVTGCYGPVVYRPGRKADVPVNVLDVRRAEQELNWKPRTPLEEGIAQTWEWVVDSAKGCVETRQHAAALTI